MIAYLTAFLVVTFIMAVLEGVAIAALWVEVKAMKESTHSIQYIDPLEKIKEQKLTQKEIDELNADPMGNITL